MAYLNELIDSIYSWRKDNKITYDGELNSSDLTKFALYIQKEIANNFSFSSPKGESTLILYTGVSYKEVHQFCQDNSGFYYISDTDARVLWDDNFQLAINEAITGKFISESEEFPEITHRFFR